MTIIYIKYEFHITCPNCDKEFNPNDWGARFDLAVNHPVGEIIECPFCNQAVEITESDIENC